jgi:hypothetical protein
LAFVSLLGTPETFLCSVLALLLDALQLLMSAGTLISLEDKLFPSNIFYYKQDIYCLYVIYLLNSILYIIFFSSSIIIIIIITIITITTATTIIIIIIIIHTVILM